MWPPGAVSVTVTGSDAEVMGPIRVPTFPASRRGSQWTAKIRSTPAITPWSITSSAPPGMTSSAGWKSRRTPVGSRSAIPARTSPAPSTTAV